MNTPKNIICMSIVLAVLGLADHDADAISGSGVSAITGSGADVFLINDESEQGLVI